LKRKTKIKNKSSSKDITKGSRKTIRSTILHSVRDARDSVEGEKMRCDSEAERYLPFTRVILHPWRTSEVRYAAVGAFARRGGKVRSLEALSL
jgi:hypothetical protein